MKVMSVRWNYNGGDNDNGLIKNNMMVFMIIHPGQAVSLDFDCCFYRSEPTHGGNEVETPKHCLEAAKCLRNTGYRMTLAVYFTDVPSVAQHSIEKEHKILFDHTKVINKSSHYWDRTIKEAIEIKLEKNNFNRDGGLQLSQAWTPALDQLRPSYNQGHEDHGPRTATDSNRRNRARRPPNFTQESREGRSLRGMIIPGPGLVDPPTNPISPETA
ncbi:hypothetical protein ANN_12452 [Periplaneta americana]|uniref:Uncharacterized protein n=1 Tax=Periplaneta americana TaxID=6978 RepID=A0ABQ8TH95_PERAM|nr:hypothetical protein ANN_12452 [Periplaneta americana]